MCPQRPQLFLPSVGLWEALELEVGMWGRLSPSPAGR